MTNIVSLSGQVEVARVDTLMRIRTMIDSKEVTASQLAKEISVSPATISQILNDSYKADPTKNLEKMAAWLKMRDQRHATPHVNPGFVMTTTARQIMDDMAYAQISESIVVIYGASGVGKTETLRQYKRENNNVWRITASPSRSSLTECLYELAMELGMDQAPRRKGPLSRVIRRRLEGTEGLVVIDEADHLDYPTLEELRILQEETSIGMVLVGNNKVYTQLTGGRRNEDFARLFSRIAKKRGIHKTKRSDVKSIAEAWGINGDAERNLMIQISERPGGLRLLTKTLKLAAMFASGEPVNEKLLRHAFAELNTAE